MDTKPADIIFFNGHIIPIVGPQKEVEALCVTDGKISFVGSQNEARKFQGDTTKTVDLQGKALLPGFIEPHMHLLPTATMTAAVDLTPFTTATFEDAMKKLQTAIANTKEGWLIGFGYDPSLIKGPPQILVSDLDKISTTIPIFVLNLSGHIAYVNSKAYEAVGITKDTPDPTGGRIMKDANGNLNGVIQEVGAIDLFTKSFPKPSPQQMEQLIANTLQKISQAGCTAIVDAGIGTIMGEAEIDVFKKISQNPNCPLRFRGYLTSLLFDKWNQMGIKPMDGDDRLKFIKIKIWADGSTQGYTAALKESYLNSTAKGFLNYTDEKMNEAVGQAITAGWSVAIHANGDAGIEQALQAFEKYKAQSDAKKLVNRIEHFTVTEPEQVQRLHNLGMSPTFTIGHVYYWGKVFRDTILGPDRAARIDSTGDCVKIGMIFSLHSDSFTTPVAPLQYVQTAVTRAMRDGGEVLGPEQKISLDEALRSITIYPSQQVQMDDIVGSLEVGKYADLVILEKSPYLVEENEIAAIPVVSTYLQGKEFSHK